MGALESETYLLLLLSDGNLPTGSFVSSSGLESYFKHGFPLITPELPHPTGTTPSHPVPQPPRSTDSTMTFVRDSLEAYARLALPFATQAHETIQALHSAPKPSPTVIQSVKRLDDLYDAMSLNHIAKRSSKAQGVALLTLYSKGFSRPDWLDAMSAVDEEGDRLDKSAQGNHELLVDEIKLTVRRGDTHGHLPICWGVLTGALNLSTGKP